MILKEFVNPKDRTVRAEVIADENSEQCYGIRYYANGDTLKTEFLPGKRLSDVQEEASKWVDSFEFLV